MNVEVAVIPAAGRGSRMLDATRVVPKALLPLVDRPALQWVLEEAVAAGVRELIVVVSPGVDDLIFSHFEGMGGLDRVGDLQAVSIRWVVQERPLGLGHAVLQAREAVEGRPFLCMLGDNIMPPGSACLTRLERSSDGRSVMALRRMTPEETAFYGIAELGEWLDDGVAEIVGAVEKPGAESAPSDLGFLGRYLFTAEVFDLLAGLEPGYGGEIQLTDAIEMLAASGRCLGAVVDEAPLDVGDPTRYLEAMTVLGLHHPETGASYREFLASLFDREMKPLAEAQRRVLEAMTPLPVQEVPLADALGLVLSEPVAAPADLPPFANSAMDGFAVRAADTAGAPVDLEVLEDVPAGSVPTTPVGPGTATRIMTGAPMPPGADAVVMVEETASHGDRVSIGVTVAPGTSVRAAGSDVAAGQRVFEAGTRLGPAHLGLLAALGITSPRVRRRARVAVLSTGHEVLPPETGDLPPGSIRDANRPLLAALAAEAGAEVIDYGIVPDDAGLLRATLAGAAAECDAVLTSGGVSMGDYDLVKQVLAEAGTIEFWRVAMQPAKPFAFGSLDGTPLFGLPGNPVSVTVAFEQFVRPALLHRMGNPTPFRPRVEGILGEAVETDPEKVVFLRVSSRYRDGAWHARLSGGQSSHVLAALAAADAFAVVPVGVGEVAAGAPVELEMFRWPESRTAEEVAGWTG